jgi:hypothetical protein
MSHKQHLNETGSEFGMSRCSGAAKQLKNHEVAEQAVSRDTISCQKQATLTPLQ